MRILLAALIVLCIPTILYPLGIHPALPYSLSDLVREEYMTEVWQKKARQAYHGTGYRIEWINGKEYFRRDGQWCRYKIPADWQMEG